jgi:hypothetical protein
MRELVKTEIGGSVMGDDALWLRCRLRRRTGPRGWRSSADGGGAMGRGGDAFEGTTSALPSRERDRRNFEDSWLGGGRTRLVDLDDEQLDGANGSRLQLC